MPSPGRFRVEFHLKPVLALAEHDFPDTDQELMSTMTSSETSTDSAGSPGEDFGEFALIARMAARLKGGLPEGVVGIGDDCAALPLSGGGVQLLTCDVMVDGRHFKSGRSNLAEVGWRAATANVSDICACGGLPGYALVSLLVPPGQRADSLEALYEGLAEAEAEYGFRVIGGNVSGSDVLAVDLFMMGEAPRFVPRGGAQPGDRIAVSGTLGDAAAGLALLDSGTSAVSGADELVRRHRRPRAEVALVPLIQRVATSAIDISDGLSAELHHLAEASGARMDIRSALIPLSQPLTAFAQARGDSPLTWALHGGEDFRLLFTFSPDRQGEIDATAVTMIGEVREGSGVFLDGAPLPSGGWDHLAQSRGS